MKTITLDKVLHRGQEVLLLRFPKDERLIVVSKQLKNIRWSATHKSWYTIYSIEVLKLVKQIFTDVAYIDESILNEKIAKEENVIPASKNYGLSEEAKNKIEKFKLWLRSRRYSESTVKTYTDALQSFLKFYSRKSISEMNNTDVIVYNNEFILKNKLSASYQNQVVNAVKLFFREMEKTAINVDIIHRPKRPKLLPNVLSKEEVKDILNVLKNIKHRMMLSLIYSCGLRRGELLNLKITAIDSKRKLIIIKEAKGMKDRIAPLSEKIITKLREYYKIYKPQQWLFEGQKKGEKYSEKSLESVLKQALEKTKIKKPVSLHWLRHSYATHLLESGTDLRYIQEILGHKSSKTTEIYTHVSTKNIQNIKSPYDGLDL